MIHTICGARLLDKIPTTNLLPKLGLEAITSAVSTRRLRWYGHVCRSSGGIKKVTQFVVPGGRGRGRPRKTWIESVKKDILERGLSESDVDPMVRPTWRAAVNKSRLLPTPVTEK